MKNRERLMNQSLYDTILSAQKELDRLNDAGRTYCILDLIGGVNDPKCNGTFEGCISCIAAWLNEEAK